MDAYDNIINFLTFINEPHVRGVIMFWGIIFLVVLVVVYFIVQSIFNSKKAEKITNDNITRNETTKVYIELDSNLMFINCYIDADQAKEALEDNPTHQINVHELKRKPDSAPKPRIINEGGWFK